MTPGNSYSPPSAFGRFRLQHQIGTGVLGPVFRTFDEQERRLVAVKAFTLDITPERAAELSNRLQHLVDIDLEHPHIARPIATGVEESVAYLAQQYVEGESLDAAIRQYGPAPAADVLRMIGHVAEALDLAARVGVFHGSMHPRDIIVTPVETRVTGLGVPTALEGIGQHGPIRRPYAAPERESGLEWGAAADVFSLAAIAYEVLTGRRALPGTEQPFPGLADLQVRDVAALREILETAIDPDPDRRPARAGDFASALAPALVDAGTARASGERGGASRRRIRARGPKLPGLDDPLMPEEATVAAAAEIQTSAGGREPSPAADVVLAPTPAPAETRYRDVADWDAAVAAPDHPADENAPIEVESRPPEPVSPLPGEPSDLSELRITLTPRTEDLLLLRQKSVVAPPRAEWDDSDTTVSPSLFAPESVEPPPAPSRSPDPDSSMDAAGDAGPLRLDLSVPRAIDPTRSGESLSRPSMRFESPQAPQTERAYAPIAIAAAAGLLLGLLGGYEMGARWGRGTPATTVAPPRASAVAPAGRPVPAAPSATPAVAVPAPATRSAPAAPTAPASLVQTDPAVSAGSAPPPPGGRTPAKTTPAPAVIAGRITLRTTPPGAEVSLDGERAGISPRILRNLPLGAHVVRATLSGYVAQERKVTITAAQPAARVDFTLRRTTAKTPPTTTAIGPASVASAAAAVSLVSRPPGARVLLDGKDVGTTPLTLNTVAPGRHAIELRLAGYGPWTTSITVEAGKPQRVTASLERDR